MFLLRARRENFAERSNQQPLFVESLFVLLCGIRVCNDASSRVYVCVASLQQDRTNHNAQIDPPRMPKYPIAPE